MFLNVTKIWLVIHDHMSFLCLCTVICKSLHTASVAKQVSVAVGWVKIKFLLMAQLKGLTAKFKLM